jgi:hypothetical protein
LGLSFSGLTELPFSDIPTCLFIDLLFDKIMEVFIFWSVGVWIAFSLVSFNLELSLWLLGLYEISLSHQILWVPVSAAIGESARLIKALLRIVHV